MRLSHIGLSLTIAGTFALAPAVYAQSREDKFRDWDRNHDGRLEMGEMQENQANFRAMDCDHDGSLTYDEFVNRYQCNGDNTVSAPSLPMAVPATIGDARFQAEDGNRDGVISRGEWRGQRSEFDRMDRNNDGTVTWSEYSNPPAWNSRSARFDELDRNNNGSISRGEWRGESVDFRTADRNRDNRITRDEYAALYGGAYGTPYGSSYQDQRFRDLDRNNDGRLTSYEWRGENVTFASADRNGDRVVTRDEYLAATSGYYGNEPYRRVGYDPRAQRFYDEDRNRDGRLSRSEWQGERGAFDILDRNNDHYVSEAEYRDRSALSDQFTSWDSNRDGSLTRAEFRYGRSLFDRLDVDRNGVLSRDEYLGM